MGIPPATVPCLPLTFHISNGLVTEPAHAQLLPQLSRTLASQVILAAIERAGQMVVVQTSPPQLV